MLAAMEYDEEGMPGAIDFSHTLDHGLKALLKDIQSGEHEFKDEDLLCYCVTRSSIFYGAFS